MRMRDYSAIDPAIHATREEDIAFERGFGPWAAPTPVEAVEVLAAFPRPWGVCGGYAVEAFTGVVRPHDDLDVASFGATSRCPAMRWAIATTSGRSAAGCCAR